jgi:hypothetical protein
MTGRPADRLTGGIAAPVAGKKVNLGYLPVLSCASAGARCALDLCRAPVDVCRWPL